MDVDADGNAALSSSERVLIHLETRVLDYNISILGRALLISTFEEANEATVTDLLDTSELVLARRATQCSTEAGIEKHQLSILEPCMGVHACAAHHQGLLYP